MIGYITLGSNDVGKSADFYQKLFDVLGASRVFDYPNYVAWQVDSNSPMFSITTPYNKQDATVGNGTMIALEAPSIEIVNKLHELALSIGAVNEGDPGDRDAGFYCAYFRDLDGNKLNVYNYQNT